MSLADTRPPWLTAPEDLENLVSESGMQVYVNDLRKSRHGCSIVDNVLTLILQHHLPGSSVPSEFELNIARQHLAVELQNMFRRWSEEGLKATLEGSFLKQFYPMAMDSTPTMGRKDLDLQIRDFRPVNSPSSSVTMDTVSGQQMSTYLSGPTSVVIPMKRSMEDDEMTPNKAGKFYYTADIPGEKDFRCPYNVRDPTSHPECAGKRFPNPRKLKEHIWRFTKPFKCPNCFEGFGRDKTKAIHCDQRKVKCVTAETNDYEGSAEQQRDKAIERAKNTPEILLIFEQYDRSISSPSDPRYQQPYDDESSGSYNDNDNDNDNDDDDDDDEETPDRESPRSEDSGSLTPVATATNTTSFWKPPPPPITLRIPQGPDTYPTPPGDHTSFSPSQQSIGSPYQQTMNAGDFTPSRSNYNLDVNFGQSTPTAIRSPVAQYNTDDLYSPSHSRMPDLSTPIPQILVTQNDPASPMMPVGYHNHYPLEQQMGPPSPRRPQQQEQSSNTYLGASGQGFGARHGGGVQQGEVDVVTFGYGTFPPAKIRMRI